MVDEIKEFNLNPEEEILNHDLLCIAQAGKLLEAGCLETEMTAYGTAVYKDDDIYYYITAKESNMEKFIKSCYLEGLYPTPPKYFSKRYNLPQQTEERKKAFRLYVAQELQKAYPQNYFRSLQVLTEMPTKSTAWPLLNLLAKQLENCFDIIQLKIYENLLQMLLPARLLTSDQYQILQQWLEKEYEKLSIEPAKAGRFQRTYAGFAYLKQPDEIAYFFDACPTLAQEKQVEFLSKGIVTTPMLVHTYFADSYMQANAIRDTFKADMETYLGMKYIKIMQLLRNLPKTVDQSIYDEQLQVLEKQNKPQAVKSLRYYGSLWNVVEAYIK